MVARKPALALSVTELHPVTLGGSTIANAIGCGWQSPIRTFGELTRKPGFERHESDAMRLGTKLQPVIFSELRDDGYDVCEYADAGYPHGFEIRDAARPWLVGHPDGFGENQHDGLVVEAKAQAYTHEDVSAVIQLLTYMHLGGYAGGLLATLAGLHVDVREVERSETQIELILHLAERFMEYVWADEWPPATGHNDDRAAMELAYPATPGKAVRETRAVRDARRELKVMREQDGKHGARSRRKAYLEGIVTQHMGDATELVSLHDETVARWTPSSTSRFDTKRFRVEHPGLAEQYTTTTPNRRLSLA